MFDAKSYLRVKSKVKLTKEGSELKISFNLYDSQTGEALPEIKESLLISELQFQKSILEEQITAIDNLIKDLGKL